MTSFSDADVALVAGATSAHHILDGREHQDADGHSPCVCGGWWDSADGPGWDQHMAEVALTALHEAGRLVHEGAETRVEWATRLAAHDDYQEELCSSFDGAGLNAEERARRRAVTWGRRFGVDLVAVMRRDIHTGPWLPASPSTEKETPNP